MNNLPKVIALARRPDSRTELVLLAVAGSIFLTLCARIHVPMWPVPMTMQSFGVIVLALAFGARIGTAFSWARRRWVFILCRARWGCQSSQAAAASSSCSARRAAISSASWQLRGWWAHSPTGGALVYLCGGTWLAVLIGPEAALAQGMLPFLLGDLLKAIVAVLAVSALWRIPGVRP